MLVGVDDGVVTMCQGESEGARVKHGAAEWKKPQAVSIDATLIQYPTLHKFQQKTIEFTLKQVHNPQISLPRASPHTHTALAG